MFYQCNPRGARSSDVAAPPYMKLFWGDYHKATRHLTRDQHGAYFLLIGEAWRLGGALPDDDAKLAAWSLCAPDEWASIKPVVMDFFSLRRGKWWHDRVREELAVYESTSRKRKEAGKRGGKASVGKVSGNTEANALLLPTKPEPEPEPDNILSHESILGARESLFEEGLSAYPSSGAVVSNVKAARQAWVEATERAGGDEPLLAAVRAYASAPVPKGRTGGAPSFERWLNEDRWSVHSSSRTSSTLSDAELERRRQILKETK